MPDSDADINLEKCFDNVLRAVVFVAPAAEIQSWHVRGRDRQYGTSVGTDVQAYTVIGAVNAASAIFQGSAEIVSVEMVGNR